MAFELYDFKEDFKQYSKLGEGAYGTGVEALGEITGAVENTGKAVKLEARICDVGKSMTSQYFFSSAELKC